MATASSCKLNVEEENRSISLFFFSKITLQSPEAGTPDFAPRKFSIRESQGDRESRKTSKLFPFSNRSICFCSVSKEEREVYEKKKETSGGQFVNPVDDLNKTLPQGKAKVLQNIDTFFYIGTEVSRRFYFGEKVVENFVFF